MQLDFIDHFAISVKNLQKSFDWYQKVFGFEMFHQWKTTWLIQLGSMKIGLFERPNAATIDDLDNKIAIQHLAFHVSAEELIAAQIQLAALKIDLQGPEDTGVAYSIFVSDPDGHLLELTTYYGTADVPAIGARESCAPGSNGSTQSSR
jgi:catechol 2,3-dioxygenase-like lactoylglutathione lyase family enzyme